MGLFVRRTAFVLIPGHGTIKIVRRPKGVEVTAPERLEIVDRKGRPLNRNKGKQVDKPK
jgi:hypothetical protein